MKVYLIIETQDGLPQDPIYMSASLKATEARLKEMQVDYLFDKLERVSRFVIDDLDQAVIDALYRDVSGNEDDWFRIYEGTIDLPIPDDPPIIEINREAVIAETAVNDEITDPVQGLLPHVGYMIAIYLDLQYLRDELGIVDFMSLISALRNTHTFGGINALFDNYGFKPPIVGDKVYLRPERYDR